MISKITEQLLSEPLSDEALYELYNFSITLTQLIKLNYGEEIERYCFEKHSKKIEKHCRSNFENMLFDNNPPF